MKQSLHSVASSVQIFEQVNPCSIFVSSKECIAMKGSIF